MSRASCFLLLYRYPHASSRAFYYLHGGVHIVGVYVFHFSFGDFFKFGSRYLPRFTFRSFPGTFFHTGGFSQQVGGGRRFHFERKSPVFIYAYFHWNNVCAFFSGGLVKFADEIADIYSMLAERRTYRRSRIGFAGRNLQFYHCFYFLCHMFIFFSLANNLFLREFLCRTLLSKF